MCTLAMEMTAGVMTAKRKHHVDFDGHQALQCEFCEAMNSANGHDRIETVAPLARQDP